METKAESRIARRRFTVGDYHLMAEAGLFAEDDRVELIDGEVVEMTPIGARHAACVRELNRVLSLSAGEDLRVDVQNPIRLGEYGEPRPDLAVVRARDYGDALPGPEDVLLVMEVADTSLAYDREVKLPLYAGAGISETWIVDLSGESIERHREPSEVGYRLIARAGRGEQRSSTSMPNLALRTDAVLGRSRK